MLERESFGETVTRGRGFWTRSRCLGMFGGAAIAACKFCLALLFRCFHLSIHHVDDHRLYIVRAAWKGFQPASVLAPFHTALTHKSSHSLTDIFSFLPQSSVFKHYLASFCPSSAVTHPPCIGSGEAPRLIHSLLTPHRLEVRATREVPTLSERR